MCEVIKGNEHAIRGLIQALRLVSGGQFPVGWNMGWGLCSNMGDHLVGYESSYSKRVAVLSIVHDLMAQHPDHTGNRAYPIPGSPDALHGLEVIERVTNPRALAMDSYISRDNFYTGTYGKTRREWAGWIADKLEEMLNA